MSCVFCEIINKKVNAEIIYENESVIAFLDHYPITPGHCLVIPRNHFSNIMDVNEEVLSEIIKATKKVGNILMERYKASGFNIMSASGKSAQQTVFHLHFHVIPRHEDDELNMWFGRQKAHENAK